MLCTQAREATKRDAQQKLKYLGQELTECKADLEASNDKCETLSATLTEQQARQDELHEKVPLFLNPEDVLGRIFH